MNVKSDFIFPDRIKDKKSFYKCYTFYFILVSLFVFGWFAFYGKTLINKTDTWKEFYKALAYYSKYLRGIIRTLLYEHRLRIPSWDFSLGEGADILDTLQCYAFGDPFNLLCFLVPIRYLHIYYDVMVILRLFLAGISFSLLCFETGEYEYKYVLTGALSYIVCSWCLQNVSFFTMFINPLIFFPLIIIGIERVIKKKGTGALLVITVAVAALSNIYVFYMYVMGAVIYSLIRLAFFHKKNLRMYFTDLFSIGFYSFLGVTLTAAAMLPVILFYMSSGRVGGLNGLSLFFPLRYYSSLPELFLSAEPRFSIGIAAPVLLSVIFLIREKGYGSLKIYLIICFCLFVLPIGGSLFNGFNYSINRWIWIFNLLLSYIFVVFQHKFEQISPSEIKCFLWCSFGLAVIVLLFKYSRSLPAYYSVISVALLALALAVNSYPGSGSHINNYNVILFFTLFTVAVNGIWKFSDYDDRGIISTQMDRAGITEELLDTDAKAVLGQSLADGNAEDGFLRYSGKAVDRNANILWGISSTQIYWSFINPAIARFREMLAMEENALFSFNGYSDRAALLSLAGVRYYLASPGEAPPYGFSYISDVDLFDEKKSEVRDRLEDRYGENLNDHQVITSMLRLNETVSMYRNDNPVSVGYTYDDHVDLKTWDELNPLQKQELMLQSVVLEEEPEKKYPKAEFELTGYSLPYEPEYDENWLYQKDGSIINYNESGTMSLKIKPEEDGELYLWLKGFDFEGVPEYDLYFGDERCDPYDQYNKVLWNLMDKTERMHIIKDKIFYDESYNVPFSAEARGHETKTVNYYLDSSGRYTGRHDFLIHLGYIEKGSVDALDLRLYNRGIYKYDSMEVMLQPMDRLKGQIRDLNEEALENVHISDGDLDGDISLSKDKILCLAIPYSTGWTAYVDGAPRKLFKANIQYMALELPEGKHHISLRYRTPFLKEGMVISAIGLIVFVICLITGMKKQKRK